MDIYTNENEFSFNLEGIYFLGIRIIGRNSTRHEIAFIEKEDKIILNLDINSFPAVRKRFGDDKLELRHAKIEIEYIIRNAFAEPFYRSNFFLNIIDRFIPKKTSAINIKGKIQPEFYITLPKGWKMAGNTFFGKLFRPSIEKEGQAISITYNTNDQVKDLSIFKPFVDRVDNKRRYSYLTDMTDIYTDGTDYSQISFDCSYISQISGKIAFLSLIPIFFLLFSLSLYYCLFSIILFDKPLIIEQGYCLSYLIVLMSYSFFYVTLIKEGYNMPGKYYFAIIVVISLISIFLTFLIPIFSPSQSPDEISLKIFLKNIFIFLP